MYVRDQRGNVKPKTVLYDHASLIERSLLQVHCQVLFPCLICPYFVCDAASADIGPVVINICILNRHFFLMLKQ